MNQTLGIDEVGRGALVGPISLGGVAINLELPRFCNHFLEGQTTFGNFEDLKIARDSKKLSPKNRQKISEIIQQYDFKRLVLSASNNLIDRFGIGICLSHLLVILVSVFLQNINENELEIIADGQIKILEELNPDLVNKIILENNLKIKEEFIKSINQNIWTKDIILKKENKADDKYLSIALASILAKVQRDNYMTKIDKSFPEFDWKNNKGYGSKNNRIAIQKNITNPFLRQSFLGNLKKSQTIIL